MMNFTSFFWGAISCLFFLIYGCSSTPNKYPAEKLPNILWIVAEDISPALGCYGDLLAHTPHIDKLAEQGIRFDQAYATAPICAPARSCLIMGMYATSLGTQHLRCEIPLPKEVKTLPEQLQAAGYFTSNRNKTDYNFNPEGRWEHWSGSYAPWRQRKDSRPFFSFINVGPSHEGSVNRTNRYEAFVKELPREQLTDPSQIKLPPYYPDTKDTREVWAHYYDVLQVLDKNVGSIMDSLEADGLLEETIIFFFGDHGFGMPRYKRWLYKTGLHVPLIIRVPEKYQHIASVKPGSSTDQLVSFVDFAPTVLQVAGVEPPKSMEGQAFLGHHVPKARSEIFAARDRADDMYEMSRAIVTDRYIYIRHFMPHLPYIQDGYIFSDGKHAFRALRNARYAGFNDPEQEKMWLPKPMEELYDLHADPDELNNLAENPTLAKVKQALEEKLFNWMTHHKDLGLLAEAEYMIRSEGSTPYAYARTSGEFQVNPILETAKLVGSDLTEEMMEKCKDPDSGIRYWAVMALLNVQQHTEGVIHVLEQLLNDASPSVQILAAEALSHKKNSPEAVAVLGKWVQDDRGWLALQAARSILHIGEQAKPLIPILYEVLEKNMGEPGARLRYKDFNFSAFTSWALEWALQEMGEDISVDSLGS